MNTQKRKFKIRFYFLNSVKNKIMKSQKHQYMLLSRYQMDLNYYFGNGHRSEKHLYFDTFEKHINEVQKLWDSMIFKPEWLTQKDIEKFIRNEKLFLEVLGD